MMHPDTFAASKVEFSDLGLGQVRGGNLGGLLKSSPRLSLSFFVDKVSGSALDGDSVFFLWEIRLNFQIISTT